MVSKPSSHTLRCYSIPCLPQLLFLLLKPSQTPSNPRMRTFIITVATSALFTLCASAQEKKPDDTTKPAPQKISALEADKHYQQTLTVTGKVAQVSIRERLVYLNFEKKFPDTPFTGVIFARATNQFGDLKSLEGKSVEVSGKIEEYHDKPQIILNGTNQLKVVDAASPAPSKN